MKKIIATAALVLAGMMMVGCSSENTTGVEDCEGDWSGASCEQTLNYKGKDIDCIVWDGSHGERGMTCDFVKYHKENSNG